MYTYETLLFIIALLKIYKIGVCIMFKSYIEEWLSNPGKIY